MVNRCHFNAHNSNIKTLKLIEASIDELLKVKQVVDECILDNDKITQSMYIVSHNPLNTVVKTEDNCYNAADDNGNSHSQLNNITEMEINKNRGKK